MKLIDEKGRLFGRINIIDLLVLLVIILVAVILGTKLLGRGGDGLGGNTKITYTVVVYDVSGEVLDNILSVELPDQLMASGELLNGYVTHVDYRNSTGQVYAVSPDTEGGMDIMMKTKDTFDVIFTCEAYVANTVKNELGTQEIRIGKNLHIVKTTHFELEKGEIINVIWEEVA